MKQHLEVLAQALNKANQSGAFTLNESSIISNSLNQVAGYVDSKMKQEESKKLPQSDQEDGQKEGPKLKKMSNNKK